MINQLLLWPGIIKYSSDAELTYVCDQAAWDNDTDLHHFDFDVSDYLIDSTGNLFSLTRREGKLVKPEPSGRSMTLDDILDIVRAHAAQKGSCCIAKIYAPTIEEAFKIVASLEET
ncbi:MAG: DUF4144 family protein [Arenicellales bacterium]